MCCDNVLSRLMCCDDVFDRLMCCDYVFCDCSSCLKRIYLGREVLVSRVCENWGGDRRNSRNNVYIEVLFIIMFFFDCLLLDDYLIYLFLNEDYFYLFLIYIFLLFYGSVVFVFFYLFFSYEEFLCMDGGSIISNINIRLLFFDFIILLYIDYEFEDVISY